MYKKKNGSQHAIKLPIIMPNIRVARFSFFLAIRRFSFSGSRGFGFGSAGSISQLGVVVIGAGVTLGFGLWFLCFLLPLLWWWLWSLLVDFDERLPNIGWHNRNFNGLTTAQRLTTPESELDGSNSLTASWSTPTESALHRPAFGEIGSFLQCVVPELVTSNTAADDPFLLLVASSVNEDSRDLPSCAQPSTLRESRYISFSFSAPASLVETSEAKSQVTTGIDILAADVPGTCCSVVPFFGGCSIVAISCCVGLWGIVSFSLQALDPGGIGMVLGLENFVSYLILKTRKSKTEKRKKEEKNSIRSWRLLNTTQTKWFVLDGVMEYSNEKRDNLGKF
jgi:hypothetical protein